MKLERNYIDIWGSGAEASDISKNQIKWKPDIYLLKRKLHNYDIFLKAYVVKLERNYIDMWGSGGDSPQKPATFQRIRLNGSLIFIFFTFWQCSLIPQKNVLAPQLP